jgi:7-carboxy-7-deazaguanine synthase
MTYLVKEIFYSLQGEGAQVGRPAVFCRLAGCNLWSGREEDRSTAVCRFCDTDFVGGDGLGGGRFESATQLATAIWAQWPQGSVEAPFVVLTGGEPTLQVDEPLLQALHALRCRVAIETNGTRQLPNGLDWVCVSPKARTQLQVTRGNELKLVFPQLEVRPTEFESLAFEHWFLQPMDGPKLEENTKAVLRYCLDHPKWRMSLQTHKLLGVR